MSSSPRPADVSSAPVTDSAVPVDGATGTTTASTATAPAVPAKARLDWPDVAKGLSILGVVLLHITLRIPEAEHTWLAQLNLLLDPLRMPLFFLVSGFFSVKVLSQSFSRLFRSRLWFFLVPYLIWAPVDMYAHQYGGSLFFDQEIAPLSYFVEKLALGTNMYWFLHILVLFNVLLWVTRKLPGWVIAVLVLVGPWMLMPMFSDGELLRKTLIYLPAFFIGAYFRPLIARFAELATRPTAIVAAVALYVSGLVLQVADSALKASTPGVILGWLIDRKDGFAESLGGDLSVHDLSHVSALLLRLLALPAGIVLAVWLSRIAPVSRVLRFFGRHTLPIYIGHSIGMTLFFDIPLRWTVMEIDNSSANPLYWSGTWMLIAFAAAMLGAWLLHLISRIPVLGWTVVPPKLPARGTTSGVRG